MAGLEPADAGVKVPCLTTWRHPSIRRFSGKKARDWDHLPIPCFLGWVKGLEPSTPGTTIRCSNQLSYTHQIHGVLRPTGARRKIGTPEGTRTPGLLLRRQLLYPTELLARMERVMGIEPTRPAWKAGILPLNYTRTGAVHPQMSARICYHIGGGLSIRFLNFGWIFLLRLCRSRKIRQVIPAPRRSRRSSRYRRCASPAGGGRARSG